MVLRVQIVRTGSDEILGVVALEGRKVDVSGVKDRRVRKQIDMAFVDPATGWHKEHAPGREETLFLATLGSVLRDLGCDWRGLP